MNVFPITVRKKLNNLIAQMSANRKDYVKNPKKDFVRNRKINFEETCKIILGMEGGSLNKELYDYFYDKQCLVTASAFVQQRKKICIKAFKDLFINFTKSFDSSKMFKGYRLLACDGSKIMIPTNAADEKTYIEIFKNSPGYNYVHLTAIYDLMNRKYVDALIQPAKEAAEVKAMVDMVDRTNLSEKSIILADRGFESYNSIAHVQEKGWKYVIRVKDIDKHYILSGRNLPKTGEFDMNIKNIITNVNTKKIKAQSEIYRYMPNKKKFKYLDENHRFYSMPFRVLRIKISENIYECLITNLDKEEFSADELKQLYHMRWGIETSFRELKYAIGLNNLHAKKLDYIMQEIYARLTMYNYCETITTHIIIEQENRKYIYQLNYTMAIVICKKFLKQSPDTSPTDVEAHIKRYLSPVRPGRQDTRNIQKKRVVSFLYRVA